MKEDKFIIDNKEFWGSFEKTLKKLQSKGFKKFENHELTSFITDYNRLCGQLSYCRTHFGNTNTAIYLNRLVASAHGYIYTTGTSSVKKLWDFLSKQLPALVATNKVFIVIATSVFLCGFFISLVYTLISPANAGAFLPSDIIESVNFKDDGGQRMWDSPVMSSYIFTNNIKVGIVAFALGIFFGIGTCMVLLYNGFMLGTITALAYHNGVTIGFWALILPHGILELFAIFVCGGAGLMLGYALINPGIYSRKDCIILKGRSSIRLILGTIPIFVIAGLIEGFITPSGMSNIAKLIFALFTLVLLAAYLVYPSFGARKLHKRAG